MWESSRVAALFLHNQPDNLKIIQNKFETVLWNTNPPLSQPAACPYDTTPTITGDPVSFKAKEEPLSPGQVDAKELVDFAHKTPLSITPK